MPDHGFAGQARASLGSAKRKRTSALESIDSRPAAAFDLIVRGFAHLERSLHPVEERQSGPVRYLHWPQRGRRGAEFSEEFFALDLDPDQVLTAIQAAGPGRDFLIAEVAARKEPAHEAYFAAGFEHGSEEPLMLAELTDANSTPMPQFPVRRLMSMAEAERILAAHRSIGYPERLFSQAQLDDPDTVIRVAFAGDELIALGKMALVDAGAYITDVMTMPDHRRQGWGEAVVRQLHADARAAGLTQSALTSTAMARSLYERLGYQAVGVVTLYVTPEHQ
jgi:GNAT superfamily N-acetyltransferase